MRRVDELSPRRKQIVEFIHTYFQHQGRPPTVRDIQHGIGVSSTAVVKYHLDRLEREGFIRRERRASRGLQLTAKALALLGLDEPQEAAPVLRVPIVGYIVAGEPVTAYPTYDEDVDTLELTRDIIPEAQNVFALRVRGDSMVDASVHDGDIVILRQQEDANNGDMVAVWLEDDEETTLKYFYREGPYVRLQPANPAYEPIVKPAEVVRVQGKVIAIIRRLAA